MQDWQLALILYSLVLAFRSISNFFKYYSTKKLESLYNDQYIENKTGFVEKSEQVLILFRKAGLEDSGVTVNRTTGMVWAAPSQKIPQYERLTISVFDNITLLNTEVIGAIKEKFKKAKGTFLFRAKQSLNPIFWVEFLLELPKHVSSYLGQKTDTSVVKIIQLIYWLLGILIALEKLGFTDFTSKI
ncbi:MAG: hypothetical protein ABJG78_12400 [Cyclobacteriaceae bacterium]